MQNQILIQHQRAAKRLTCPDCGTELDVSSFKVLDPVACPECRNQMVVPAKLGKYELYRFLGEGAMGRVYLAADPDLERDVAIKILREDLNATPKMWSLLEKEAKAAARINHPNVIQIYGMGKVLGRPYIVMELAEYASLEERMRKDPVSGTAAVRIAIDVMEGLKAAYDIHLIHGDIKPANILVTRKGRAKVADFGLARFMDRGHKVERWGTPYYIAPEKTREFQEDFRSDMYSLGATLFHVVNGRAPFEGKTGEEVIEKSLKRPTPSLAKVNRNVSRGFSEVVYRMMRKDPDDRFWSYDQAIACFKSLEEGTYRPGDGRRGGLGRNSLLHRTLNGLSRLVMDPPSVDESE